MLKTLLARLITWLKPAETPAKNQWVTVGISFILAVTLWILVTLNTQTYTTHFDIPIKLVNVPTEYQLTSEFPKQVRVLTRGIGIKMMYQGFRSDNDTLEIDFQEFKDRGHFAASGNLSLFENIMQTGLSAVRAYPDSIPLLFALKDNKRVPVKLDIVLNLLPSYRIVGDLKPDRQTVLLVGPEEPLENITEWKTVHFETDLIKEPQYIYVPLDTVHPFQVKPNQVAVHVNPVPFTEKEIAIAVRKTFLPRATALHLEPDSVVMRFLVPLADYGKINAESFFVEVDYRNLDGRSDYVIPKLRGIPEEIEIVEMSPRRMKYLIVSKE